MILHTYSRPTRGLSVLIPTIMGPQVAFRTRMMVVVPRFEAATAFEVVRLIFDKTCSESLSFQN